MNNLADEDRLIVFVKAPVAGKVKTRLAGRVGTEVALTLYRCFVADILATVRRIGHHPLVFFHPPHERKAVAEWLGDGLVYVPQEGNDLGERMAAAFRRAFVSCSRALLVGSDCPDLPGSLLTEAFECLKTYDAVLGPAVDGGYYLIGFTKTGFLEAAFDGIEWGTPSVFEATATILRRYRVSVHVLPLWNDIDEYDDLKVLYDRQRDVPRGAPATMGFLKGYLHW
jgi:uncharacterized protein